MKESGLLYVIQRKLNQKIKNKTTKKLRKTNFSFFFSTLNHLSGIKDLSNKITQKPRSEIEIYILLSMLLLIKS